MTSKGPPSAFLRETSVAWQDVPKSTNREPKSLLPALKSRKRHHLLFSVNQHGTRPLIPFGGAPTRPALFPYAAASPVHLGAPLWSQRRPTYPTTIPTSRSVPCQFGGTPFEWRRRSTYPEPVPTRCSAQPCGGAPLESQRRSYLFSTVPTRCSTRSIRRPPS